MKNLRVFLQGFASIAMGLLATLGLWLFCSQPLADVTAVAMAASHPESESPRRHDNQVSVVTELLAKDTPEAAAIAVNARPIDWVSLSTPENSGIEANPSPETQSLATTDFKFDSDWPAVVSSKPKTIELVWPGPESSLPVAGKNSDSSPKPRLPTKTTAKGSVNPQPQNPDSKASKTKTLAKRVFGSGEVDRSPRGHAANRRPHYPSALRNRPRPPSGLVVVTFVIEKDGKVSNLVVVESKGPRAFEKSTLKTIRTWRFEPAQYQGRAVSMRARKTIRFGAERR